MRKQNNMRCFIVDAGYGVRVRVSMSMSMSQSLREITYNKNGG